jgi:hypothetical protein
MAGAIKTDARIRASGRKNVATMERPACVPMERS